MVFNKSRNLFALNLAKNTKLGRIILTEGYMDTISLYQSGFDCAVASLGTALTVDHAKLLSRFTKEVVICYDADSAGIQAANRAIPMLEKTGLKVRVLRVTGAKDPDEFLKKYGPDAFSRLLDQSENYVEYNLRQLQSNYDLSDPVQKTEFARAGAEILAQLDSPVEREAALRDHRDREVCPAARDPAGPRYSPANRQEKADPTGDDPRQPDPAEKPPAAL